MLNLKIAYIGGGSMGWARVFMTDLALEPNLGGEIRLYDIDMEAAKRNEIIGNTITSDERSVGKWKYIVAPTLSEALTGADFVVISILPGTFEHMRSDVHMPERLGIYQSVGDTVGPGGILRALRTVPEYVKFAEAIRDYCPDAWVINYTNPMSQCIRTLYHVFPQIKAFGCCHEVFGTQELLAAMYEKETGIRPKRDEIKIDVAGLNHFTWFTSATYKEQDLTDLFARYAKQYYDTGFSNDDGKMPDVCFTCTNRVKFDLFKRKGFIAAAGDRHLAEFMPGDIYLKDPETVRSWGFYLTHVDWRVKDRANKIEQTRKLAAGEETVTLTPSGEEGILLIKALCGLETVTSNVNLPVKPKQKTLPYETIIETNAVFSKDSVVPVANEKMKIPTELNDLIMPHVENQALIFKAAYENDREAVYEAFEREPLIKGRFSQQELRELADDMIIATQI